MATEATGKPERPQDSSPKQDGPQGMSSADFPDDTTSEIERDMDGLKAEGDSTVSGTPDNDVGRAGRPAGTPGPGPAGTPGKEPSKNPGVRETKT